MVHDLIVWDFDGVLNANIVDGRFVWADGLEADLGIDTAAFQQFVFGSGLIREVVRGARDLRDVVEDWLKTQGPSITPDALLAYWFEHDALPDAEVLGWLKSTPGHHVIGTNNEARRAAFIETQMGYSAHVKKVFASGRMGVAKPDAGFFAAIEKWAGLPPHKILLIDDHAPNIAAAQDRGWSGFHFTPETRADLPNLLELT